MLTRRQQLDAKNAKNQDKDNGEEDDEDMGQPPLKRPASKTTASGSKAAAKAKGKAKAKPKAKAKASPKKRPRGRGKKTCSKGEDDIQEGDAEEHEEDAKGKSATKRQLFDEKCHMEGEEEELKEDDPMVEPKPAKKTKTEASKKPKATPKRKAAAKPKKEAKAKAQPKRRPRKSTLVEDQDNVEALHDETMKGVFLQSFKEVKTMTHDDMKELLVAKKESMHNKLCRLNIYWHTGRGAVTSLLDPKKPFDVVSFSFKTGTWNSRMAGAFTCAWLAATSLNTSQHSFLNAFASWCPTTPPM